MRAVFLAMLFTVGAGRVFAQPEANEQTVASDVSVESDVDEPELDRAARLIFESASRAYEAGDFQDALDRYVQAYDLSQRALLLYNIALCHDRLDNEAKAAEYYERFVSEVPDSPRAPVARSRAEILRASEAEREAAATPVPPPTESQPTLQEADSRSLAGPIAAFGVAGVGLITFAVAGLLSSSRLSSAEDTCAGPVGCDVAELDGVDRASLVADIGLGVAIAGAVVGTILLLVGRKNTDEPATRSAVTPLLSPSAMGAQLEGTF